MLTRHFRALKNEIIWSTLVQVLGKGVQIALGIVSIKMVTNALGAEEFGMYGKISEFALFFSTAANLGIFGNTIRKMSESPSDGKLFVNALILRIGTAFLFFLAGGLWAALFIDGGNFLLGSLFFMGSLLLDYVTSVCDGMLQANYRMGRATLALIGGRILNLGIVTLLFFGDFTGAPLFFLGPLAGAIFTAGLSLFFVRMKIKFVWKLDPALLKMLFLTALPFGIINIVNSLYFRFLPSFFATKVLTNDQYGAYTISLHVAATASLLSTFVMFSSLPALKRAIKDHKTDTVKTLLKNIQKTFLALGALLVIGGSLLGPWALGFLSGRDFIKPELWFLLPLLLLLAAISYFYDLVLIVLFAFEKEIWFLKREGLVLCLALSILSLTYISDSPTTNLLLILISSITAETTIVLLSLKKIKALV